MNQDKSVEAIARALQEGGHAPHDLVAMRSWLSGQYAFLSGQLTDILMQKPAVWNELRKTQKSDTATERVWQGTVDGLAETKLRLELKVIEKLSSAIKTQIEIAIGEARQQF